MSKKLLKVAAPIALSFLAPGIGTALGVGALGTTGIGAGLGALGGLATGGGLKGALLGAAGGGLGSGLGASGVLGTAAGSALKGGIGPTAGTGILGAATRASSAIGNAIGGAGSSFGNSIGNVSNLASLGSNYLSSQASDKALKQQEEAQKRGLAALQPYAETGVNANAELGKLLGLGEGADQESIQAALAKTPGYQFNMNQGTEALNRSAAARGGLFSGAAAKELQQFGQGLADNTYQSAVANLRPSTNLGASVAGSQAGILDNIGALQAGNTANKSNLLNQSINTITGGGIQGAASDMVYDPRTGKYVPRSQLGA